MSRRSSTKADAPNLGRLSRGDLFFYVNTNYQVYVLQNSAGKYYIGLSVILRFKVYHLFAVQSVPL